MAADLGIEVTLVEADARIGGTCLLRGCIPSKALLHVAKVIAEARDVADWGVGFGPMSLDLEATRARKEEVLKKLSGGLAQLAKRRKVRCVHARGIFVDSRTLRLEGGDRATYDDETLTFDHCIVATGSMPAARWPCQMCQRRCSWLAVDTSVSNSARSTRRWALPLRSWK